ncbi:hypothetical protein HMPREF1606_05024 [Escherichia coli 908522]|nr:hypothetical protein HMPREF1606_05024 [Escherichia coli 908522]ESE17293.1 hypothetical protein HMPREF1623_04600 [Escherichia coli 910096-2]
MNGFVKAFLSQLPGSNQAQFFGPGKNAGWLEESIFTYHQTVIQSLPVNVCITEKQ